MHIYNCFSLFSLPTFFNFCVYKVLLLMSILGMLQNIDFKVVGKYFKYCMHPGVWDKNYTSHQ